MTEKLLQYLWNYKIFTDFEFRDAEGNTVEILDFGIWNHDSGPDFLNAKIKTKDLVLAGNVELHLRASDWFFHGHSGDRNYDNLILHAVFINDAEIPEIAVKNIPTIELKNHISPETLAKYEVLMQEKQFIPCEKIFDRAKIPFGFAEETLLKKLDEKSMEIERSLQIFKNNYEAVLFHNLAYAFGLKVNAQIFRQIAEHLDFSIIQKIRQNPVQLEALFFGKSGWLENAEDENTKIWKREYDFLKAKYGISEMTFPPKFLRLRAPNFPTLRLSQLANLYHSEQNLFSKIIKAKNAGEIFKIFDGIKASEYWGTHYNFGNISPLVHKKTLTKAFVELIIINAILPIKYAYHKNQKEEIADEILEFYTQLSPEKNTITDGWKNLGLKFKNALGTQAFIYHYKNFCLPKNCLNCSIGFQILKT